MSDPQSQFHQEQVSGDKLVERVKELVHEGNVRHLVVKHEGHTVVEFPVNVGAVGLLLVPWLAAVGAIGALVTDCTIDVVREPDNPAV